MKRQFTTIISCIAVAILMATVALAQPPAQEPAFGKWHRLNPDPSERPGVSPVHQVLHLRRAAGVWEGPIDKHPEPQLGFENPPLGDRVNFSGLEIGPDDVVCIVGLPFDCPGDVAQALDGTSVVVFPQEGEVFAFPTQWLVVDVDGETLWEVILFSEVIPGFFNIACPWFRTFDEALAANPFPLPFNGVDFPAFDCFFEFPEL